MRHMAATNKVLRVGVASPLKHLDPRRAHDAVTHLALAQVYETPFGRTSLNSPPAPLVMAARLSRETANDGTLGYSASVRKGLLFSDGTPVTPDHVIASLGDASALPGEVRLSRRDDRVVFTVARPIDNFEFHLSKRWCMVLLDKGEQSVGTGPFMFADRPSSTEVRMVRNPHHRAPVPLDEVVFRVFPPETDGRNPALVEAVKAGEIHFTAALARDEVNELDDVRKLFHPGDSAAILFLNTARKPLADRALRRALALGIDRYELARACHPESPDLSARGLLPPTMGMASDGIRHDPREARARLEAAEASMPSKLRTLVVWGPRPYIPRPAFVVAELNRQLADLGVQLDPVYTEDPDDYFAQVEGGDYDVVLGGWIADSEDPTDFLEATLASSMVPGMGRPTAMTANFCRWQDTRTDTLIQRHREASRPEHQRAILEHIGAEAPLLPLMYGPRVVVHARNVQNVDPDPFRPSSFAEVDLA